MFPSRRRQFAQVVVLGIILVAGLVGACLFRAPPPVPGAPRDVSFCFWNVENLFDDHDDQRLEADEPFDNWYASNPEILQLKLDRLTDAILRVNDGQGPDILAIVEVESVRAAELLRDALNHKLHDESLHYQHVLMKNLEAGRHIAPAILTRLPVDANKTQLHGKQLRILEGHIVVNGHDLVVIASHWSSRTSDETGIRRAKYADQIYGVFKGMWLANPKVDLLVCGDCNDTPDDVSITQHLHATGNRAQVLAARGEPLLFNLLAGKSPQEFGTHSYRGQPFIYDQIFVSPAMLEDSAWTCRTDTIHTMTNLVRPGDKHHKPWRFGGPSDKGERGSSDHFPITVGLHVTANAS